MSGRGFLCCVNKKSNQNRTEAGSASPTADATSSTAVPNTQDSSGTNAQTGNAAAGASNSNGNSNQNQTGSGGGADSGTNTNGAQSPTNRNNRRDRSLREAPIIQSLVALESDQVKLKKDEDNGGFSLDITFSATPSNFEVSAKFKAHIVDPQNHNIIPDISYPDPSTLFTKSVTATDFIESDNNLNKTTVTFSGIQNDMLMTLNSPKSHELPNELPLVVHVKSLDPQGYSNEKVNAVWLYCNLRGFVPNEKCEVLVLKKLIARSNRSFLLQDLFGGLLTVPGTEGDGQECVVCLSAPREVVVLHCKHVCLCKACASVTSSTWSYQCPICRGRVAAFVAAV